MSTNSERLAETPNGGNIEWRTAVSEIRGDVPYLHGYNLESLAQYDVSFAAVALLAATGELPSRNEAKMANAILVLLAAHGISPNGALSRIMAACGVPIQVSVGVSAMSTGDYHGGSGEQLAYVLSKAARIDGDVRVNSAEEASEAAARYVVDYFEDLGERLPGFGHPMHSGGDPRAPFLLGMARELGVGGYYCALGTAVEEVLGERKRRQIRLNVTGASAAILSDLGVPWRFMRVFNIAARTPVAGALGIEEIERERRWRMVASGDDVRYDGVPPRDVPDEWQWS
jgi:citrate synthase